MSGIAQRITTLRFSSDAEEVRSRAHGVLAGMGARTDGMIDGWDRFGLGSRVWLRLWGVYGTFADRHLPLIVRLRVGTDSDEAVMNVVIDSDEGWYAYYAPRAIRAYERRYDEIVGRLSAL